jgi:excisionase family DNA binding protein
VKTSVLLTLDEVAEELRCSRRTVYRLIAQRRGGLPVVTLTKGGPMRVKRSDLERYIERRKRARA